MAQSLVKFFRLPKAERRLLMRAGAALLTARLSLMTMPFTTARKLVGRSQELLPMPAARLSPERVVWAIEVAGRAMPLLRNCLAQALAAQAILARVAHPCELRIGVAKNERGELLAHAWLESGDRVLIGEFETDRYHPLSGSDSKKDLDTVRGSSNQPSAGSMTR